MMNHNKINTKVKANYALLNFSYLYLPLFVLLAILVFLYFENALNRQAYAMIQKNWFLFLNDKGSPYAYFQYNLTQLGDALVALGLMSVLLYLAPKVWEALISASLLSLLFSKCFKIIFSVPRPAAVFEQETFTIVGRVLTGNSSLPSGHSITIFTTLAVLMWAFVPQKTMVRLLWYLLFYGLGFVFAFTRVGVGAHYPLDVITGAAIGTITAILGIIFSMKYSLWTWVGYPKFYPFFALLFAGGIGALGIKLSKESLPIFYLPILFLLVSIYFILKAYAEFIKKK